MDSIKIISIGFSAAKRAKKKSCKTPQKNCTNGDGLKRVGSNAYGSLFIFLGNFLI